MIPELTYTQSDLFSATINDHGDICNAYSPLQNLADKDTKSLRDFTTSELNFDLQHPVDMIPQDSYDGSVNLVMNDGKNIPRIINSRFSIQEDGKFLIPDHTGLKDTNIYDEETFNVDSALKSIPHSIPKLEYLGMLNNAGSLSCGSYTFFFKLADADGNETEIVQESGIVQVHIGDDGDPQSSRMGMEKENSTKALSFKLTNIDNGFDYVHVLFCVRSSAYDQQPSENFFEIKYDYPVTDQSCIITITGSERILECSSQKLYTDYADIAASKTQTVSQNVLLMGNTSIPIHDYDAIRRMSWKIIPSWGQETNVGNLDADYSQDLIYDYDEYLSDRSIPIKITSPVDTKNLDNKNVYYNSKNVYYSVGYWPDEIYRFGIVYIFEDNSLSPVFNIQGVDFQKLPSSTPKYHQYFFDKTSDDSDTQGDDNIIMFEHEYEPDDFWFDKKYRLNSRGVVRFPNVSVYDNLTPKPLYIKFDFSHIGKGILDANEHPEHLKQSNTTAEAMFKFHKIKGFFFVRQKRVPTTIAQGLVVGLLKKDFGSVPVIKDSNNRYISQSFLSSDATGRMLNNEGRDFQVNTQNVINQAMLVPDAEMNSALFNSLFVSNDFCLKVTGRANFQYEDRTAKCTYLQSIRNAVYKTSLLNVPEESTIITNGTDYFTTKVGNAASPEITKDPNHSWRWTLPQDLTSSDTLIRGQWGSYVGLGVPEGLQESPFKYGDIVSIKPISYYSPEGESETAVDLDFQKRFTDAESYQAICERSELVKSIKCYRGDCFQSMFTHRVLRNFIDPETPTNTEIVNPACWAQNYGVRCTAEILSDTHSNMTSGSSGWYIEANPDKAKNERIAQAVVSLLFGNIGGFITNLVKASQQDNQNPDDFGLGDQYAKYEGNEFKINGYTAIPTNKSGSFTNGEYYKVDQIYGVTNGKDLLSTDVTPPSIQFSLALHNGQPIAWNQSDLSLLYPNGYANEIVTAFEVYQGSVSNKDYLANAQNIAKYGVNGRGPRKRKVEPQQQEKDSKNIIKNIFKSSDKWQLRGIASINRSDVNAVGLGQWITFPICSSRNLAYRDVDSYNTTEEASFNRKRSFYPLYPGQQGPDKGMHNPLPDSNVINSATGISLPSKSYFGLPNVPFIKQEYFTRIYNSLRDTAKSFTNEFKVISQNAYQDYPKIYGNITKIVDFNNYVYVIFSHGIGALQLQNAETAEGFLPPSCTMLSENIGSIWKDSILTTEQGIYGVDSVAKCIWKISANGLQILSEMHIEKFLIDNLDMSEFETTPFIGHRNIKTHFNAFKNDIMFTYYNDKKKLNAGQNPYEEEKDKYYWVKDPETLETTVYKYELYNGQRIQRTDSTIYINGSTYDISPRYASVWVKDGTKDIKYTIVKKRITLLPIAISNNYIISNRPVDIQEYNKTDGTTRIISDTNTKKMIFSMPEFKSFNKQKIGGLFYENQFTWLGDIAYLSPNLLTLRNDNRQLYGQALRWISEDTTEGDSNGEYVISKFTTIPAKIEWQQGKSWSICYNELTKMFTTFYDWIPLESENIDNIWFSFDREAANEIMRGIKPEYTLLTPGSDKYYYMKKWKIDSAFTNTANVYKTKLAGGLSYQFEVEDNVTYALTFYIKGNQNLEIKDNNNTIFTNNFVFDDSDWHFVILYFKYYKSNLELYFESSGSEICEVKLTPNLDVIPEFQEDDFLYSLKIIKTNPNKSDNTYKLWWDAYDLRNSSNSLQLWKHGQAGVYDNQGKIKPTHWYGKQHEFNFEFVVNETPIIQKLFYNLNFISNKVEPYKFEYEVVGEGYEWYKYKQVVNWINDQALKEFEANNDWITNEEYYEKWSKFYKDILDKYYKLVLSTDYETLRNTYSDFPLLFNMSGCIKKLPYLMTKKTERKGTKDETPYKNPDEDKFKDNKTSAILIEDEQLNEYRLRTEQLGNDVKKYGRVRGNMQYLEDCWKIEIRPMTIEYAYLDEAGELKKLKSKETRLRDKYIKIKVRYTGEDLALIYAVLTTFDYSYA